MKHIHFLLALLLLLTIHAGAQDNRLKKLDRQKWKELVDEINRKRYDKKEQPQERNFNTDPQEEYREMERDLYGSDDEYGDEGENGTYNGNSDDVYGDDNGIYNGSAGSDDEFFSEENDREPSGQGPGEGGELPPEYGDEGSNGSDNENGKYDPYENRESPDDFRPKRTPPPTPAQTRAAGSSGGDSTWLIIVLVVVLAAAVVYMIFVSFSDKNKKVKAVQENDDSKFENLTITKTELELALEAALANQNYREAVRIYFIAIIKEMKDRSWIRWERKKTNYHYINEISGRSQQGDFITATRAFEIVWYGNRSLGENEYRQLEPHFKKLLTSIH